MQYTVTPTPETATRRAAVNALAIVGFIALVFVGIALAIYAARFIPTAISRIGSSLGLASVNDNDGLVVIPPQDARPFPHATTTPPTATTTPVVTPAKPVTPTQPTGPAPIIGYTPVYTDYPTPGSVRVEPTRNYYGLANLKTEITSVGYVDSDGDFVADRSIKKSDRLAVKFIVRNTGTNESGDWNLEATLPTKSDRTYDYTSRNQDSIAPGAKTEFLVYLDKNDARSGDDQDITITADADKDVDESNEGDNTDSAEISVD